MSETQPMEKSIQRIKFMFQTLGLVIEDRPKKWLEIFFCIVNFLWLVTDIIAVLSWIGHGIAIGRSLTEVTQIAPCVTLGFNAVFKSGSLVLYEKKVHRLLNNLKEMERDRITDNAYGRKMSNEETKNLHLLITSMTVINLVLAVFFDFVPLVVSAVKYFTTNELELFLPFLDVYPFDCYDLKYWPFAFIHQIWTGWLVLAQILAGDYFFYVCCTHIKIQFQLLQHEVENVIPDGDVPRKLMENAQIKGKFNDFVQWHQDIISCADMLEDIYSKSTLFNYVTSSIIICLTGFQLTTMDNNALLLTYSIIFVVGMTQIFFLCFFGDMLMVSSLGISEGVYNCKWYFADVPSRRSALNMLIRSQTPCKVTAAGFADVNLNAFMKIISSSWSYFTLLQTMNDQ